jgi:Family of unknown function (DUF6178)
MTRINLPREKKVGHLTLHRQPSAISNREFKLLNQAEQLAVLQTVSGRRKYDLLIESADARQLVQQLPAQEVYLLARELGAEDVPELIAMASSEQVTTIIDLDCWNSAEFDRKAALRWLSLLLEGDDELIIETLAGMEIELLTAILQQWLVIHSGPEDLEDDDARAEAMNRSGGYAIDYTDAEAAKPIGQLLNVLLKNDYGLFHQLVESVRQELPAQLEEDLYRWRNGRLEDFGFSAPDEARTLYSWLDPESFPLADYLREGSVYVPRSTQPPGYLLADISPRPLLAEILAKGLSQDHAWELTYLLNKLMITDQVDPGDREQVTAALERLYGTLNLALEYLAGHDVEQAEEFFQSVYFEYLFRLGFSLTLQLGRRAGKIIAAPVGCYLDVPLRPAVEALSKDRPEFYLPLEGGNRATTRLFSSLKEVELAGNLLERLELQVRLIERHFPQLLPDPELYDLTGCEPDQVDDLTICDLFLTALANQLFGRELTPAPLALSEVPELHQRVTLDGTLNPQLRDQTREWLENLEVGGSGFADWCLGVWDEEFCPLRPEELNPRYLSGLIIRL